MPRKPPSLTLLAPETPLKRGLALASDQTRKEVSSLGGVKNHLLGTAHEWGPEEAGEAGVRSHQLGKAHQWNRSSAAEAGRRSGEARRAAAEQRRRALAGKS